MVHAGLGRLLEGVGVVVADVDHVVDGDSDEDDDAGGLDHAELPLEQRDHAEEAEDDRTDAPDRDEADSEVPGRENQDEECHYDTEEYSLY